MGQMGRAALRRETRECRHCGRPFAAVAGCFRRFCSADCGRAHGRRPDFSRCIDPTPEQIAARCLAIQAEWSGAERVARMRVDKRPLAWLLPGS